MQRKIHLLPLLALLLATHARAQGLCFEAAVDYAVGNGPMSVVAADLNGDGDQDLVATAGFNVSILKNNGDGTYAPAVYYAGGVGPRTVIAADLDGDGDLDLAVTNDDAYFAWVSILKNNGDGTFASPVNYETGKWPRSVVAVDLDGDGDRDLAVANWGSGTVSILKNIGNGTFTVRSDYATGGGPWSVVAADLDGDGDQDLATANSEGTVSALKNNGNGTFAAPVSYIVGTTPYSVVAADLDGDGDQDLAAANYPGPVSILKNNGNAIFAAAVNYAAGSGLRSVFAADLDGNGDQDLAVVNEYSNNTSVLKNIGNGTFAAPVSYAVGIQPWSVFAADLDGDGNLDLAVANCNSSNVSVLINCQNQPPVALCQSVTIEADSTCHAEAFISNGSYDPDAGDTITFLQVLPGPYPQGQTSVQLIVTDNHGAADTCAATVTVQDKTKPKIACPTDTAFENNDPNQCGAIVTYAPTATDNCSTPTLVYSPPSGSFLTVGPTTVRAIATDGAGNEDTCNFIVKVRDVEKPSVSCPGDLIVSNDPGQCGAVVTYAAPVATDNCPGVLFVASVNSGSTFPVGATPVKIVATDASGNKDSCSFTVTVQDTQRPTIARPGDVTVNADPGLCGAVVTFSPGATDNCPGVTVVSTPSSGAFLPVGTTIVRGIATDAAGNKDTCYFSVTVTDTERPRAYCPRDIDVVVPFGQTGMVVSYTPSVTDNCPGATLASWPGSGSFFQIGTTTVTCTTTDAADNADTCTFHITVRCSCSLQGDINGDAAIDVFDVIDVIGVAFSGDVDPRDPECPRTRCDVNNDGVVDVFDAIYLIATAFSGGASPVDPCGL